MAVTITSDKTQRVYSWTDWKASYAKKGLPLQWDDDGVNYTIWSYDGPEVIVCQIWKGTLPESILASHTQEQNDADKSDFETNYKTNGNSPLGQIDVDGAQIVRIKAAKKGWTFNALPMEFTTSTIGSLYSKTADGTNRTGITCKFYDSTNTEVTTAGLLGVNETTIVKTVLDFEPPYDYEVIGGELRIDQDITSLEDCRLYIIAVPDVPEAYGGSKEMAGGVNLRFLAPHNVMVLDGRVSKTLFYNATNHTNKLRFILLHTAGLKCPIHITIQMFRL